MFPDANIPVIQLSLDYNKPPQWHHELAKELAFLRKKGLLIMGRGNIVHNLARIDWAGVQTFDWAVEANETVKALVKATDFKSLCRYKSLGSSIQYAVPMPEHF